MKKGFFSILIAILASAVAIGAFIYAQDASKQAMLAAQNAAMLASENSKFGSVTATQLTDTIGTFRTNVNTDLSNLDTHVTSMSSTLDTRGTLFTVSSPVPVANGGTALTAQPTDRQVLTAVSGVMGYKTLTASSGITISTSASAIFFSTPGFDNTANINFTGNDTFSSGTTSFNATSTFASSTIFSSLSYGTMIASGSAKISSIAPGSQGNVLISSGSVWTSNPIGGLLGSLTNCNAAINTTTTAATDIILFSWQNSGSMKCNVDSTVVVSTTASFCTIAVPKNHTYLVNGATCNYFPIGQ